MFRNCVSFPLRPLQILRLPILKFLDLFFSWVFKWFFNSSSNTKFLSHSVQLKGFLSVCVVWCIFKSFWRANVLPQVVQLKGLCFFSCFLRSHENTNFLSHLEQLKDFSSKTFVALAATEDFVASSLMEMLHFGNSFCCCWPLFCSPSDLSSCSLPLKKCQFLN